MVGTVHPAGTGAPKRRRKDKHREQEEDTCHLKPKDAAHTAKWLEESSDAARYAAACCAHRAGASCCAGGSWGRGAIRSSLRSRADALACHPPGNTQTDTEHPANGFRSHFDMMVTAAAYATLCTRMVASRLPSERSGSKVIQTHAAPERRLRRPTSWRYS